MAWAIPNEPFTVTPGTSYRGYPQAERTLRVSVGGETGERVSKRVITGACHLGFVRSRNDLPPVLTTGNRFTATCSGLAHERD